MPGSLPVARAGQGDSMTVAAHRPPHLRFLAVVGLSALCVVLGLLALWTYGVGPSFFLFALAGVGAVDAVVLWRGPRRTSGADRVHPHR